MLVENARGAFPTRQRGGSVGKSQGYRQLIRSEGEVQIVLQHHDQVVLYNDVNLDFIAQAASDICIMLKRRPTIYFKVKVISKILHFYC